MNIFFRKHWTYILITILGLLVSLPLIKSGYFSHQDDLQVIRIFEMRRCFSDFQIPCRWTPDMGWGNGMPLFNFYGVFTYYLGALLSYFVGFIGSAKLLFFISLVFGSFGMYLLINDLLGKEAGLVSAIFYMFAPYKALDVYVRGALAESMALSLIPFVFYFGYKLVKFSNKINTILFTIFLSFFCITHNIMTVIFIPVLFVWIVYWLILTKFNNLREVCISLLIAFGMSSFFIIPAFMEKNLVQTESLTRFELDYRANFISLKQLFLDRVWGYGTSIPGPEGGMNFQIGWPYWLVVFISIICLSLSKVQKETKILILGLFALFIFSIFMTHNKSAFIWERIEILSYFQFPWRFLSLSIFTSSILAGTLILLINHRYRLLLAVVLSFSAIFLNFCYFKPREYYAVNDQQKLSGKLWDDQKKGAILDYLPKTALEPREAASDTPLVIRGEANVTSFISRSNRFSFDVEVKRESEIHLPVYYFPNWTIKVNGSEYLIKYDNLLGRIAITLPEGRHSVVGNFENTKLRLFANTLSFLSILGFIIWTRRIK